MATPKAKPTLQDYWKIPFRGFVPGGLGNEALPELVEPSDAPVMEDSEVAGPPPISAIDIAALLGKLSSERRRYFHTFQIQVGEVETVQILGEDNTRHRAIIRNVGPGDVFLGNTESVGRTGYSLAQSTNEAPFIIETTEAVWAIQEEGQSSNAVVHVLVEFDKQR